MFVDYSVYIIWHKVQYNSFLSWSMQRCITLLTSSINRMFSPITCLNTIMSSEPQLTGIYLTMFTTLIIMKYQSSILHSISIKRFFSIVCYYLLQYISIGYYLHLCLIISEKVMYFSITEGQYQSNGA